MIITNYYLTNYHIMCKFNLNIFSFILTILFLEYNYCSMRNITLLITITIIKIIY